MREGEHVISAAPPPPRELPLPDLGGRAGGGAASPASALGSAPGTALTLTPGPAEPGGHRGWLGRPRGQEGRPTAFPHWGLFFPK